MQTLPHLVADLRQIPPAINDLGVGHRIVPQDAACRSLMSAPFNKQQVAGMVERSLIYHDCFSSPGGGGYVSAARHTV